MADEGKKVSFGFSKSIKKPALKNVQLPEEKKIDYIDCVDKKTIKVIGQTDEKTGPLVIPLLGGRTWHDRILNKTDADVFEPKSHENGAATPGAKKTADLGIKIKQEVDQEEPKTLEEQAASEIIQDLRSTEVKVEKLDLEVPVPQEESLHGEQESNLDDYEQVPIDVFGLAMLRGMGWTAGKGIGKNGKLVAEKLPELRPRGMGLGADKVTMQKNSSTVAKTKEEESLKLEIGCFVKIIAGKHANNYGQVECFDDDAGRIIVKMALSGESESLNGCLVQPVTKDEYGKNSKFLNAAKYQAYKSQSGKNGQENVADSDSSSEDDSSRNHRKSSKKSKKKRSKYTSESSDCERSGRNRKNSSDEQDRDSRRTRRNSSDGEELRESRHHKKSKKSRGSRNDSRERSRSTKKEKSQRDEYSESDRRKHKKHKRKRSKSPSRR